MCSWYRHVVVSDTRFSSDQHIVTPFSVHHLLLAPFFVFSLSCLSYINISFVLKMGYLLTRAKMPPVTFFMKWSYLLPRENFKLPYPPDQARQDPGICTQLRSSHIHSIHKNSRDFMQGNLVYLVRICAVWSGRGRAGKKVTSVTFFRCPTVLCVWIKASWFDFQRCHFKNGRPVAIFFYLDVLTLTFVGYWVSTPNSSRTSPACIGRRLQIFSDTTFKIAAEQSFWIVWFPDSNSS